MITGISRWSDRTLARELHKARNAGDLARVYDCQDEQRRRVNAARDARYKAEALARLASRWHATVTVADRRIQL